jgi:hypothetical protein
MIKKITFLVSWLILFVYVSASDYQLISQTLGVSAEHISLGSGMFITGSNSIFSNDAYFSNYKQTIDIFATQLMTDHTIVIGSVSYRLPTKTRISIGSSISLNAGFDITTQSGIDNEHIPTGETYNMSKYHYKVSASQSVFQHVYLGSGINIIHQKSPAKGIGYTMDFGFKYFINTTGLLGIAVRNILSKDVNYSNSREPLPRVIELGLFQPIYKNIIFSPSIMAIQSDQEYDVNYLYSLPIIIEPIKTLRLMGSVSQKYAGLKTKTYFNFGTQLNLDGLSISYTYRKTDYKDARNQHFISLQINT